MLVPYSDHHTHLSPFYYLKPPSFDNTEGHVERLYNKFDTDVGIDQISLRRKLSFPYFYSPVIGRSSFTNPILRSHIISGDIQFPESLTTQDELSSSDHSLDLSSTENDDDIMISGSHDSHVIELPELRQPSRHISDSVLKMSPFSLPPPTHTQSHTSNVTVVQEMSQGETGHVTTSHDDQHRMDFQNGRIDYTGRDSFENIQRRLDALLVEEEEEEGEELQVAEVADDEEGLHVASAPEDSG